MEIAKIPKYDLRDIPIEIAAKIREHIELYDDYESFSKVCLSWRLAFKEFGCEYINRKHTQLPWLMLVDPDDSSYRRYYSLTRREFLKIDLPPTLSPSQARRYFSSRGWLVSVSRNVSKCIGEDTYFDISIFNPLSKDSVIIEAPLFHLSYVEASRWEEDMLVSIFDKFTVSTCPNNAKDGEDDLVVAMIFGGHREVAYWRLGLDITWIVPDSPGLFIRLLEDLCFFRGELYATQYHVADTACKVIAFGDFKDHKNYPQPRVVANLGVLRHIYQLPTNMEDDDTENCCNYYLVESKFDESNQARTSSLLVIRRDILVESFKKRKSSTASFNVFKLNVDNGNVGIVESLGNQAIFVGFNSTFSVNVDDDRGCKADCIYYTDELFLHRRDKAGSDMGIYSLREGNKLPFYEGLSQLSDINPPLWIELSTASSFSL